MRRLAVILVALLALSGCASEGPIDPTTVHRARELVQLWRVDAPGETDATWLSLGQGVTLWSSCGIAIGSWRASDTMFLAGMTGSIRPWCAKDDRFPDWLENATQWRIATPGHPQLLSADGKVLAKLYLDGAPPSSTDAPSLNAPPTMTPGMITAFRAPPVALPADAKPVTDLSGRWIPSDAGGGDGFIAFSKGGWTGSDGCNGAGGRWLLGPGGLLLTTAGAMTLMGCDHMTAAPSWVAQASRAGMVGAALTLYGQDGAKLGSFTRG